MSNRNHLLIVFSCLLGSFANAPFLLAEDNVTEAVTIRGRSTVSEAWDAYTVHYPAGRWNLKVDDRSEDRARFQLTPVGGNEILVMISMMKMPVTSDPHYENNPHSMNTATLLAPALELAQQDESRIHFTVGTANLPSGWDTAARAIILMEEGRAVHLEAFHDCHLSTGHFVNVIVMTRSEAGRLNQDPAYLEKIIEAYEMIQRIDFDVHARTSEPLAQQTTEEVWSQVAESLEEPDLSDETKE